MPAPLPEEHRLDTLIGHHAAIRYLRAAIDQQVLPHALLLHGPAGLGKRSLAWALTKYANAPDALGDAKWAAEVDRKTARGLWADTLLLAPTGATNMITLNGWRPGKDDPENLQYYRFVETAPLEGRRKFLIVRDAHRMNVALANCLLKLIEEPPSYLNFILLAPNPGEVLTTVRSRCAPVKLSALPMAELREFATKYLGLRADDADTAIALRLAEGRPGQVQRTLSAAGKASRAEVARTLAFFQQYGFLGLFRAANDLLKSGGKPATGERLDLGAVLDALQTWLRDVLVLKTSPAAELLVNGDLQPQLAAYAVGCTERGLLLALDEVAAARLHVPRMTDRAYVIEALLMKVGALLKQQ